MFPKSVSGTSSSWIAALRGLGHALKHAFQRATVGIDGVGRVGQIGFKVQVHARVPAVMGSIQPLAASTFNAMPIWRGVNCFLRAFQA